MGDNLPKPEAVNNENHNNGLSVASSVSLNNGEGAGGVVVVQPGNGNLNNNNSNNNNNNSEYSVDEENDDGDENYVAFVLPHTSQVFVGAGARARFNEISAEVIEAHPEWDLYEVQGNPLAYGNDQPGYVLMISTLNDVTAEELFEIWPQYVAAMEARLPGLNLPVDLQAAVGYVPHPVHPNNPFVQMAVAMHGPGALHGGRKQKQKKRAPKYKTRRVKRRKTQKKRRNLRSRTKHRRT